MFEQKGMATKALPNRFYHYCNLDAFLSIMQSKKLWLTSAKNMNDPTEIELFYNNLKLKNTDVQNTLVDLFTNRERANSFLCCFSKHRDLLSQWRAYGDDGRGISIGFDGELMGNANKYNPIETIYAQNGLFVQPVDYGTKKSDEFFDTLLKNSKDLIESTPNKNLTDLFYFTDFMSVYEKNEYYQEEDEIRAVYFPFMAKTDSVKHSIVINQIKTHGMSDQLFRTNNGKILPYFEWDLTSISSPIISKNKRHSPICEVVLGPKCAMSVEEVKYIIDHIYFDDGKDYYQIEVRRSSGDYR